MTQTELSQEYIYRADLNSLLPQLYFQIGGSNVIFPFRCNQGQDCERLEDSLPGFWAAKSLQQFLKNQSCRENTFAPLQSHF
jgi:hypothetical protein